MELDGYFDEQNKFISSIKPRTLGQLMAGLQANYAVKREELKFFRRLHVVLHGLEQAHGANGR